MRVDQFADTAAVFDPVAAGFNSGSDHLITYSYTNEYGVPNSYSFNIAVDSIYPIYIDGLLSEYCVNDPVYDDDPSYELTAENHPEGGSHLWSGLAAGLTPNGDKATIRTALTGSGSHVITYEYTSIYSCKRDTSESFIIHPLPDVTIEGTTRIMYDVAENSIPLTGYPAGGTWIGSGTAIDNDNQLFNPSAAGINPEYDIVYKSFETHPGVTCYNYDTLTVEVFDFTIGFDGLRKVSGNNVYCYDGEVDTIWAFTTDVKSRIVSGAFSGAGVIENMNDSVAVFDPLTAGAGNHTITYSYTNNYGSPNTVTFNITVDYVGMVAFVGLQDEYCISDGLYQLTVSQAPAGGTSTWTGPAGFIPGDRNATLITQNIGAGNFDITYLYTSATGLCQSDTTKSFVIHPLPVLDFVIRELFNMDEPPRTITGSPDGGKFTGVGITFLDPIYQFDPSIPGVNPNVSITYEYTDSNACWNSITKSTQVVAVNAFFNGWNTNDIYCYDQGRDTITVTTVDGINPGTGQFMENPGFIKVSDDTAIFDPVIAGPGLHNLSYRYENLLGAPFIINRDIRVDSIGPVFFTGLQEEYCINEPRLNINPQYDLLARNFPTGGSHDWSGVSQGLIENGEEATIQTKSIGAGNHTITYTFTSQYGCTRDTSESFVIHPLPFVSFVIRDKYDLQEKRIPLTGSPLGGDFTGKGTAVNTEDSIFNPSAVGVNPEYDIVYTYTDINGCTNYDTNTVEVFDYKIQFNGINTAGGKNVYCYDGVIDIITVASTTADSIISGTFSGPGIHAQHNDTLEFDPAAAGFNGGEDHTLFYNYINEYGVPNIDSFKVAVDSIYAIYIGDLKPEYCVNEPVISPDPSHDLTAENLPAGGSHAWSGLAAGLTQNGNKAAIRTALIGPGTHQLTYTYTSPYNCVRDTTQSFIIHPKPTVYITDTLRVKYDKAEISAPLLGYPLGGTFSGIKGAVIAEDSTFHPYLVGINPEYNIVYKSFVTHPNATCWNYDTVTVEVFDFTVDIEGLRQAGTKNVYCYDGGKDTIWAKTTDILGRIDSGYFSGPGIIENFGDSMAIFDPVVAGEVVSDDPWKITFRYINNYRSPNVHEFNITVDSIYPIYIDNLKAEYCINEPV